VLIRPKRSALPSRAEVDIQREFTFRNSQRKYRGIPIIAANMDTVGTFEMARALAPLGLSVALHKHYGEKDLVEFFRSFETGQSVFYSMGITKADAEKFDRVVRQTAEAIEYVCIDVANRSRQLHSSGANVRDIRAAIDKEFAPVYPGRMPTPNPPGTSPSASASTAAPADEHNH